MASSSCIHLMFHITRLILFQILNFFPLLQEGNLQEVEFIKTLVFGRLGLSTNNFRHALNRFCLLCNPPFPHTHTHTHTHPVLNGQYQDDGNNYNQNQMKNACPFHIVFQVLKDTTARFFIFCCFYQLLHQQISFFTNFQNFIQHYLKKRFLSQIFIF